MLHPGYDTETSLRALRLRVFALYLMIIASTLCLHADLDPGNRQIPEFPDLDQTYMRFFMAP